MQNNRLKQALIATLDYEIEKYEQQMKQDSAHHFSRRYEKNKNSILHWSKQNKAQRIDFLSYKRMHMHKAAALIAAIVMILAAASTVVAVVKPEIFYKIKEGFVDWTINFEKNDFPESEFEYINPPVPEGYCIVDEVKEDGFYSLIYRNNREKEIGYEQVTADGTTISIDSEKAHPYRDTIGNTEVIVSEHGDIAQIIFNNGHYVFHLDGNCGKDVIYKIAEKMILE